MATIKRKPAPALKNAVHVPRVVIKFREFVRIPYEDGAEKIFDQLKLRNWSKVREAFPGLQINRLFPGIKTAVLDEMVKKAQERDETYKPVNFQSYFAADCYDKTDPHELMKAMTMLDGVELAYLEGGPVEPPAVSPGDDPRYTNQDYLDAAPTGIDAVYAWGFTGGDGNGIGFVDLERGWTLNHEDLTAAGITIISGTSTDYHGHGTAVLGEVVAVDNNIGCVGIATHATARVVSQWQPGGYNTSQAILSAAAVMNFGDVLLLEAQTSTPASGGNYVPVEAEQAAYDAIRLATALGIVVVEAGANGGVDLDTYNDPVHGQIMNRASANFRDSGAIMVGAASSGVPHTRLGFSCHGSRIDCYGWGQNINTTGDGWTGNLTNTYTTSFGGTSGASPIVTGAALVVQGIAQASLGYRFSPKQLRAILSDVANGTASGNPAADRIGVMPNLRQIIDHVLNVSPDVYIRDFVGDNGNPHASGSISASPDIITRPVAEVNPQAAFGEGSGTENNNALGYEVEAGQDNFIYVRVRNRGGAAAANVKADVYWSPVATLVTPDLWNLVGSVTIANVPNGDILTVADAITWPSAAIPATGHYCYVGLVGNAQDPAPGPADFLNWDNFYKFIRNNNNVTWRNFNVVNNVPPAAEPPGFVRLPFLVTGAPDKARPFELAVLARLPQGAKLFFEVPLHLLKAIGDKTPFIKVNKKGDKALIPVKAAGNHVFPEVMLPAKMRAACNLLVDIPKEYRKNIYEVAIRQVYRKVEVGRVTWRLTPEDRKKGKNK